LWSSIIKFAGNQRQALLGFGLSELGFWNLEATYGDASAGQRYYPYRLFVVLGENRKEVIYQSYPEASPMPEAFKIIVDRLYELVHTKL
jgi:NADH:ubiquinone oxidoreductase subunit